MTERYNCGCEAVLNDAGEYTNGSHATWDTYELDEDGYRVAQAYGTLCNRCLPKWRNAKKCKLGGEPL